MSCKLLQNDSVWVPATKWVLSGLPLFPYAGESGTNIGEVSGAFSLCFYLQKIELKKPHFLLGHQSSSWSYKPPEQLNRYLRGRS